MSRMPLVAGLALAALVALGACRQADEGEPVRARASTLPLWRQPPDKPPGPALPRAAGTARSFALRTVARGLRRPVQVVARRGARGRLYVAEQGGRIRVLQHGRMLRRPYLDLRRRVMADGERGLLTLAFDPRGDHLLVMYSGRDGDTRIVRYRAGERAANRSSARTLLRLDQPYENHKGGTLLFDDRGRLVVGVGDGGSAFDPEQRAQDERSPLGKVLRRDPSRPGRGWEIVASGLRNPWRMAFDDATGMLWLGDVGQDRVEEVDAVYLPEEGQRAPNLGWAAYEGDLPLGRKQLRRGDPLVWPVAGYRHRDGRCSVTGGHVYRGGRNPALRGRYVYGDFCRGTVWSLDARGAGNRRALDLRREAQRVPGLVSFGEDLDGELYAVSAQGTVARLVAPPPDTPARSSLRMP
jgi:glucose/arabinose dehydrogenase